MDTPGERLRHYRTKMGFSGEKLANLVGTNKSKISKLESGEQTLDTKWAKKLAPHLEIKPYLLLPDIEYTEDMMAREFSELDEKQQRIVRNLIRDLRASGKP